MKLLYSGCDAVQFGTQMVKFRWKETNAYLFCPGKSDIFSKRYFPSSKLHGITLRKTVISIITSMKTSPAMHLQCSRDHLF